MQVNRQPVKAGTDDTMLSFNKFRGDTFEASFIKPLACKTCCALIVFMELLLRSSTHHAHSSKTHVFPTKQLRVDGLRPRACFGGIQSNRLNASTKLSELLHKWHCAGAEQIFERVEARSRLAQPIMQKSL